MFHHIVSQNTFYGLASTITVSLDEDYSPPLLYILLSHSFQDIDLPTSRKKFISNITVIDNNIWICTVGTGLFVYNGRTSLPVASWGVDEKQQIYTLLHVEESASVLALTHKGMFAFDSVLDLSTQFLQTLNPKLSIPKSNTHDWNEGIVVPSEGNLARSQVWVCSQMVLVFCILDPQDFSIIDEVKSSTEDGESHKIRHMTTCVLQGRSTLLIADKHFLVSWDVQRRERQGVFSCTTVCRDIYGDNRKSQCLTIFSMVNFF